jgi:hypothetical protein
MYGSSYRKLSPPQRSAARAVARNGVLSGEDTIDRAACAWLRQAATTSAVAVAVFAGFGTAALWTHKSMVAVAVFLAAGANSGIAVYRASRLHALQASNRRRLRLSEKRNRFEDLL